MTVCVLCLALRLWLYVRRGLGGRAGGWVLKTDPVPFFLSLTVCGGEKQTELVVEGIPSAYAEMRRPDLSEYMFMIPVELLSACQLYQPLWAIALPVLQLCTLEKNILGICGF